MGKPPDLPVDSQSLGDSLFILSDERPAPVGTSQTVEPVFGQIKSAMGCKGFLRRGLEAVQSEWSLICACFNLGKLQMAAYGD